MNQFFRKYCFVQVIVFAFILFNLSIARAEIIFTTDLAEWESMVTDIEILETTADNVALADEVTSSPGPNAKLGPVLTFQTANTGLSLGFMVESLQAQGATNPSDPLFEGGFTFDDHDGGNPVTDSANALSVGDTDDFEDDDWTLSLLDGASVTALGVEIRHSRFASGESITLYLVSQDETVAVLDLSSLPSTGNDTYFIGITSDIPFDSIEFDEDPDGDDIAIADFRFAEVIPSEIEATVDLKPDTINKKSRGRYVTVYIELMEDYSVEEINIDSVVISGINGDMIDPPLYTLGPWQIGDNDWDGIPDLMVKFNRQELISLLEGADKTITVSGELMDGTRFWGTDDIRVIHSKNNFTSCLKHYGFKKKFNLSSKYRGLKKRNTR